MSIGPPREPEAPHPPADAPGQLVGRKPGDRRIRVDRPHSQLFRYSAPGVLVARPKAHEERSPGQRLWVRAKAVLVGRPLASEEEASERLSKKKALAIFSSDAISSSAYATEEIVRVLRPGVASAALVSSVPRSRSPWPCSWRSSPSATARSCIAYPTGGGSYSVSKRNFGRTASLVAASALLIDYVLTVAVSTSSAVEQIVLGACPPLHDFRS